MKKESLFLVCSIIKHICTAVDSIIIKLIKPTPQVSKLCKLAGIKLKGLQFYKDHDDSYCF